MNERMLLILLLAVCVGSDMVIDEALEGKVIQKEPIDDNVMEDEKDIDIQKVVVEESNTHILLYFPWTTRSHRIQQNSLLEGLLARGHKVTGVFPQPSNIRNPLYTELIVEDRLAAMVNLMTEYMMNEDFTNPLVYFSCLPKIMRIFVDILRETKEDQNMVIENIRKRNLTVDAIVNTINFNFNTIEVHKALKPVPLIGMAPPGNAFHMSKYLGNIENPSYMPELMLNYIEPLTFSQRLVNTIIYSILDPDLFGYFWWSLFYSEDLDVEAYMEITKSVDLIFLCSSIVTHSPQVTPPNIIEVGGIHCREGRPLPPDLMSVMDSSPNGVILVSFGSSVKPSQMTDERRQVFLETFAQLSEFTILWKWDEDTVEGLPNNVVLSKWLPQQDILAHPNLRVFVTHGGLLSLQEALYHKTPLVGIPLGNDQMPNLLRASIRGYALLLDWATLSSDSLLGAIKKALVCPDMKKSMEEQHRRFTDTRDHPVDTAVWWVEYAIRHGGAQHLKPASLHLAWYQYHLLDVIGVILITILLFLFASVKCLCCVMRCCTRRKVKID